MLKSRLPGIKVNDLRAYRPLAVSIAEQVYAMATHANYLSIEGWLDSLPKEDLSMPLDYLVDGYEDFESSKAKEQPRG